MRRSRLLVTSFLPTGSWRPLDGRAAQVGDRGKSSAGVTVFFIDTQLVLLVRLVPERVDLVSKQ